MWSMDAMKSAVARGPPHCATARMWRISVRPVHTVRVPLILSNTPPHTRPPLRRSVSCPRRGSRVCNGRCVRQLCTLCVCTQISTATAVALCGGAQLPSTAHSAHFDTVVHPCVCASIHCFHFSVPTAHRGKRLSSTLLFLQCPPPAPL